MAYGGLIAPFIIGGVSLAVGIPAHGSIYVVPCIVFAIGAYQMARLDVRRQQQQQREQGLCCHCGYDLRATPGRCPECGSAAVSSVSW